MTISSSSINKRLVLLFLVLGGVYITREFLVPLVIGGVVAMFFLPVCKWLEKKNVPRIVTAFICMLILLSGIAAIGTVVASQFYELAGDIVIIKHRMENGLTNAQAFIFRHFGITVSTQMKAIKGQQTALFGMFTDIAGSVASILAGFILMLVYFLLLLYYRSHIRKFFLKLADSQQQDNIAAVTDGVAKISQQYLLGLFKMIVCLWIMYGIGFSVIGIKNPLFFAFICGLLEIVPFIGNITGTLITVLIAAAQGANAGMLAGIVGTYGLVQFIQGWFLEPLIVGPQVKINPLFTIIALVVGEMVWGIPGIFLAIPLIAMFKILCDQIDSLKPIGFLIGEIETPNKPSVIQKLIKRTTGRN